MKGIDLAVQYFLERGHTEVYAFVPRHRQHQTLEIRPTRNRDLFQRVDLKSHIIYTPSRLVKGRRKCSYDDRFVVEYAAVSGGVIVSNDKYEDLLEESEAFKEAIETRRIGFNFKGGTFSTTMDAHPGMLEDFLSF